jgi:hypothetical protein
VSTISASVTNQPITATVSASGAVTASVGSTAVSVAVGGGIGPQGPQGESGVSTWNDIAGKPATFPPETHTHALSALTQSSATSGQVVTWSGSAWTAEDLDGNGTSSSALLLHFDGANSSTAITDSGANALTITAHDGAVISTAQSKFGGASVYLPGSGSCLRITGDLSLGTGDFTIDAWVRMTGGGDFPSILEIGSHLNPTGLLLVVNSSGAIYSGGWYGALTVSLNQWVHVAWVRQSGVLTVYLNGTATGSTSFTNNLSDSANITIGNKASNSAQYDYAGYIDELRIIKGTAVYTANFTPPTAPYSEGTAGTTMQQRRGTAAALAGVTLAAGQIAYETDTGKLKAGDGTTVYSSLSYVGGVSAWADITGKPSFATVATSGAYADLTGKPTLGTAAAAATTDFAAASHAHGSITNAGAIGSTSGQIVVTTTAGVLTTSASISTSQITGLGTLATQSGTFSGTSSGTNTGDQTITLTGDVTGSGTGSFAATLSSTGVSAGTYTSVTVDAKGRVTAGSSPAVAYSSLSGVPSTFAPSAHTHPLSELSQSGATTNQVPQWNGSAWVPATVSGGGGSSSASDLTSGTLNDARLSDKAQSAMNLYLWSNFR